MLGHATHKSAKIRLKGMNNWRKRRPNQHLMCHLQDNNKSIRSFKVEFADWVLNSQSYSNDKLEAKLEGKIC